MKCETNLTDGVNQINRTKRPGMVIIHKSTCSACRDLRPIFLASKEIDLLSEYFVMISLKDEKEPKEQKWGVDGRYFPRIYFLNPSGQIMLEITNPDRTSKFKYFYNNVHGLIQSMKRVLKSIMKCEFNLQNGLHRMKASHQPGMVIIYKTWCPVCSELKAGLISSREIDYLSNYIVITMLKDNDEPPEKAWAPDGSYIPRVYFLSPPGIILYDVINHEGDARYKYFYSSEKQLISNMRRVINSFLPAK